MLKGDVGDDLDDKKEEKKIMTVNYPQGISDQSFESS